MQLTEHNLALISSPGQYYFLLEYLCQKKLNKDRFDLILFWNELDSLSKSFFDDIFIKNEWRTITLFKLWKHDAQVLHKIVIFCKLLVLIKSISFKKYEKVVISQIETIYNRQIINSLRINEFISLDEGNAVFRAVYLRKKFARKRFVNYLGLKTHYPKKITFFTSYMSINVLEQDSKVECEYKYARSLLSIDSISPCSLLIVGQPFVPLGLMTQDEYGKYLDKILKKYEKCTDFYYVSHRREKYTYVENLCQLYGLKLINSNLPVELKLVTMKIVPKYIIGFNSAALLNLRGITPDSVEIISILINDNDANSKSIYSEFTKFGINIVEL